MTKNSDKSNVGYTLFRPTGVKHEYPVVDLQNKQVTGTVSYKDKVYMTVVIDLKKDTVNIEGSIEDLKGISMDKESYIEMFISQAELFVENNISNPKNYYEQFK
ncbi:hypothetical protein [Gracilibacillus massiliensis]|uniref:hypothetical protein n=1 Tax=Gracilibacillus massiliensis TaxID=1564956 RepID=UPI00071E054A|nr:hypothetical protein [Gracilibacillus massiliensis]